MSDAEKNQASAHEDDEDDDENQPFPHAEEDDDEYQPPPHEEEEDDEYQASLHEEEGEAAHEPLPAVDDDEDDADDEGEEEEEEEGEEEEEEGVRPVPCLGCVRSAVSGRSLGDCVEIGGRSRRCQRCRNGHSCVDWYV